MTNVMPGGWSPYGCKISKEAAEIFKALTKDLVGVNYEAVACATQVVAGTNYSFFCNSQVVYPDSSYYPVLLDIYVPLPGQGEPHITQIKKLDQ
jgi:hypothetical protein